MTELNDTQRNRLGRHQDSDLVLAPGEFAYILDTTKGNIKEKSSDRPGRTFIENGMRIYDVDILEVEIGDEDIEQLLTSAQHRTIQKTLLVVEQERNLTFTIREEAAKQKVAVAKAETAKAQTEIETSEVNQRHLLEIAEIKAETQAKKTELEATQDQQKALDDLNNAKLARTKANADQELNQKEAILDLRIKDLSAETGQMVARFKEITPDMVAALQAFGDKDLAAKMAQSMAPLAIFGGTSITDALKKLLAGTPLAKVVNDLENRN